MKSIKEKAEEYGYANWQSDEYHDGASEGLDFDPIGHTQKTFEAGANYVIDAINDVLSHPRRFANDDISISEAMVVEITKIAEQLK